jgi:hypothetical protein
MWVSLPFGFVFTLKEYFFTKQILLPSYVSCIKNFTVMASVLIENFVLYDTPSFKSIWFLPFLHFKRQTKDDSLSESFSSYQPFQSVLLV